MCLVSIMCCLAAFLDKPTMYVSTAIMPCQQSSYISPPFAPCPSPTVLLSVVIANEPFNLELDKCRETSLGFLQQMLDICRKTTDADSISHAQQVTYESERGPTRDASMARDGQRAGWEPQEMLGGNNGPARCT